jgi:hypothetical protein
MLTTAGPTADAALAIEFLPRHPGQLLESSELPVEPWPLKSAGETDADTKEFSIGNPADTFRHSKIRSSASKNVSYSRRRLVQVKGVKIHFTSLVSTS